MDDYHLVEHSETALSPEILARVRAWLQPTDYLSDSGEFRRYVAARAPGTSLWLCQTDEYRTWHDSPDHGSIWIKGVSGAGKSVLAAAMIQHIQATEDCPVLFFFCRNHFTPRALFQDWLAQLLPHSPKLQFALQSRLASHIEEVSDNMLVQLFLDGASCVPRLYCVVDALDEVQVESRQFLNHLDKLATFRPESLKILITSRPEQYLQSVIKHSSIVNLSVQQDLVGVDIRSFLHYRINQAPRDKFPPPLKQKFVDLMISRSKGLFLYSKLTMDQVEDILSSDRAIDLDILERSLPLGLEEIYVRVLQKQCDAYNIPIDIQVLVLEIVTHASRPLRLQELASLVECVYPSASPPNDFKTLAKSACRSLVVAMEDETLQIIHHSLTEFVRGDNRRTKESGFPVINSRRAHKRLLINCLRYLQSTLVYHDANSSGGCSTEKERSHYIQARLASPFLGYAVENWLKHAGLCNARDVEVCAAIIEFIRPDNPSFLQWARLVWVKRCGLKNVPGVPTALHVAAAYGLSELSSSLLEKGLSLSAVDKIKRTPLHCAAQNGHAELVSILIQQGANVEAEDSLGWKPVHLAILKNYSDVVTILLQASANPEPIKTLAGNPGSPITKGETAISDASRVGHTETLIALIPFCKGQTLEQLLCECCQHGNSDVVQAIFVQTQVSANTVFWGATALYYACRKARVDCVEILLAQGADVTRQCEWRRRAIVRQFTRGPNEPQAPVECLVEQWHPLHTSVRRQVLRLLVEAGADLQVCNSEGRTPLLLVANQQGGCYETDALMALVEAGADVTRTNARGQTALHLALGSGCDVDTVRLFLENGADPNHRDSSGMSPLKHLLTSWRGQSRLGPVVEYLLSHGAEQEPALLQDLMGKNTDLFQNMLSSCNVWDALTACWFKLREFHDQQEFANLLDLLLAKGLDVNTRQPDGRTLYMCTTNDGHLEVLRKRGAKRDATDNYGNNVLHLLAWPPQRRRMEQAMASDGLDPRAVNYGGKNLLHIAAANYTGSAEDAEHIRWLIDLGVPVNAVENNGATPLHIFYTQYPPAKDCYPGRPFADVLNHCKVDLEIQDKNGLTPLHLAAMRSEVQLDHLIAAGAKLGTLTRDRQSVLHLACRSRLPNMVGHILDHVKESDTGVSLEQLDEHGRTPLYYACRSGQVESVALLMEASNVNVVDAHGSSLLHACAESEREQRLWDVQDETQPRSSSNMFPARDRASSLVYGLT